MPLHPQARAFLDAIAAQHAPAWEELTPTEARKAFNGLTELFGTGPELHHIESRALPGMLPVRIYRPTPDKVLPVVMFFHGGGWELGNIDTHDTLCRRIAHGSGCIVVSVDYRLAPEHPFPAPLDDCYNATLYIAEHATELGIDAQRIAVCGDSAGGNLAAAVALKARDAGGPHLHSQWLIYPVIEARFDTASYQSFGEGHALTRAIMRWFWNQYAPTVADRANPLAAPTHAKSLANLPPSHIITAEFDVLRDEGEAYTTKLKAAGVSVASKRHDGMLHGFMHFSEPFDDGKRAVSELAALIKASLKP